MQQLKSLALMLCVLLMPYHALAAGSPANAEPLEEVPPPPKRDKA